MPNPLPQILDKVGTNLGVLKHPVFLRLQQEVVGLAEDFWHDGTENLFKLDIKPAAVMGAITRQGKRDTNLKSTANATGSKMDTPNVKSWHAEPGEISEKMWGAGFVTPGGNTINDMLIKPLGLTKEMSVLDLSAGLGGRMRRTAEETGAYITGLEPDAGVAARGMQLSVKAGKAKHASIKHYDPGKLELDRPYDSIIARETFYRVPDRKAFFASLGKYSKPSAQISFTDYILDPEHRDAPAILAWKKSEKLAHPMGLVEAAESWAKVGFSLRVHEDLTDFYKAEVLVGLKRLMDFLATGVQPDKETAESLLRRIETWKYRVAAMESGMKFYRFYGTKH